MLDNRSAVLFIICIHYVCTEYKIYSDGWIPVPRDRIFNQIRREAEHNIIYPKFESAIGVPLSIELVQSQIKKQDLGELTTLNNMNRKISTPLTLKYKTSEQNANAFNAAESPRKSKEIIHPNLMDTFTIDQKLKQKDGTEDNIFDRATSIADETISYSVTENIEDVEEDIQENFDEDILYNYTRTTTGKQNYNSTFINILSKYNIKNYDNLTNYDLSRYVKTQKPITIQKAWTPYSYNNLNHLPVDPLVAVFLSNYGVYIPSLYGVKSNYNNLYGYLASNNIHNNRPFGLYKVFSDTDS